MEFIFGFGLLGLLGAYIFLCGFVAALKGMRDSWGGQGFVLGLCLPPTQWLWALVNPRRGLYVMFLQIAGLALAAPGLGIVWFFVELMNGNLRFG